MSWLVLDASRYQTFTDYSAAAADLDGVILRCGLRGYTNGALSKDSKFDTHYNGFYGKTSKGGITLRIGFYFITNAISVEEAQEEAEYIRNIIGTKLTDFPIYIDSEYGSEDHDGRADNLSVEERMQYLTVLGTKLREFGYRVGIFSTSEWMATQLDYDTLHHSGYHFWLAADSATELEIYDYDGWRYIVNGEISGISSRVSLTRFDRDIANWADTRTNINTLNCWIESPVTYNGTMETPTLVGIDGLSYLVDYTVSFCNAAAASSLPYALLEGINNYTGTKNMPYVIEPANIEDLNIHLEKDGFVYTGEQIRPDIIYDTTTDLGKAFSSSQYDLWYENNVLPGRAICRVTGKNNYTGEMTFNFYIEGQIPFPSRPYLVNNSITYTGEPIEPKVVIGELVEGRDFTVEYIDNLNAGIGTAIITGKGNYEGDGDEITFSINPLNIANTGNVRYTASKYTYTGSYINPDFAFTAGSGDIVYTPELWEDYEYHFRNNISVGTATLVINGKGNYTGTYYSYFDISPAPMTDCRVYIDSDKYEYTGAPIEPEVYVELNGMMMSYMNYTIIYSNNIRVGTNAMITVVGRNDLTGQAKITFEITQKSGSDYWILNETEFTYSGQAYTPTPICMTDDPVPGRDYTVAYEDNVNAGTAKCIVTMIGDYVYKKVILKFHIYRKEMDYFAFHIDETEFIYNRDYIEPELICTSTEYIRGQDYTVSYYNNKYPEEGAYVRVQGIGNYSGDFAYHFHITRIKINEIAYIYMGDPVKYDVYDPKNFAVKTIDDDLTLVMYDDYIYDFKTITFEKNNTYNYTVYIVSGIGPCTGTIVKGFRTSIEGYEPEIPQYIPRNEELIEEEVPEDVPVVIVTGDDEENPTDIIVVEPTYIDPRQKSEKWIPDEDVNPVIPDDPEDVEYQSGQYVYIRKCKYYASAYAKYSEAELLNGTYYVYKYDQVNGRIRVTLDPRNAKIVGRTTGWIEIKTVQEIYHFRVGDKVSASDGYVWYKRDRKDARIHYSTKIPLYVTYIDPNLRYTHEVGIGVSTRPNLSTIGWASIDMIEFFEQD